MKELAGMVALVGGGATLMGRAVCRAFVEAGATVVVGDVDVTAGKVLIAEIPDRVTFVPVDLRDEGAVRKWVTTAAEQFGRIDIVVNVAAIYRDAGIESTAEDFRDSFAVNVIGGFLTVRAALPYLRKSPRAVVVNFSSAGAHVAQSGRWVYPATKAAILQLTRSQAVDLAPIRVVAITPGWTWSSEMEQHTGGERAIADRAGGQVNLFGRVADPEEIADAVVFVSSPRASFMTGNEVVVDGGYLAMGPEQRMSIPARFAAASGTPIKEGKK